MTDDLLRCNDCRMPTCRRNRPHEYYMVHDAIWVAAGMTTGLFKNPADGQHYRNEPDGSVSGPYPPQYLCIGCLEVRLGRHLTAADFTGAPVNDRHGRQSPRLRSRLATPA